MARPYSLDLRERVVAQVARGMTHEEVADLNGIVSPTVSKWCNRKRQSGSPAAEPMGGKRPRKLLDKRSWLLARLAEKPLLTEWPARTRFLGLHERIPTSPQDRCG